MDPEKSPYPGNWKSLLLLLSVCSALTFPPFVQSSQFALVIGNGEYENARKLPNATNDSSDVAEVLEAAGWDVTLAENLSIREMLRTVRLFVDRAKGSRAVLLYYAGHGIEVKGQNYLLPVDATLSEEDNEDSLPLETIALSRILGDFRDTNIRLKTIVLDCCRDNPLTRSWLTTRSLAKDGGLAQVPASALPEGTMLVFSTSPGSTAADGSGRNSPFTESFVKRARAGGGGIADVFADVAADLGERQPAWIRFDGSGVSFTAFRDYPLIPGEAPEGKMFASTEEIEKAISYGEFARGLSSKLNRDNDKEKCNLTLLLPEYPVDLWVQGNLLRTEVSNEFEIETPALPPGIFTYTIKINSSDGSTPSKTVQVTGIEAGRRIQVDLR